MEIIILNAIAFDKGFVLGLGSVISGALTLYITGSITEMRQYNFTNPGSTLADSWATIPADLSSVCFVLDGLSPCPPLGAILQVV